MHQKKKSNSDEKHFETQFQTSVILAGYFAVFWFSLVCVSQLFLANPPSFLCCFCCL